MADSPQNKNPYVGPRAFQTGEKLYGRDREVRELLDLVIAERIVLLHSPSGAGKSSLVQAGLIPLLEEEGFHVLPVARVNLEPPPASHNYQNFNRYAYSALLSLEEPLPDEEQLPVEQLAAYTLDNYLSHRPADHEGEQHNHLLIFDQFEEILTVDPTDQAQKMAFFAQLGAALRDRTRWALFSLREDFVAALAPYIRPIPTRFANTYRLDLLDKTAALQAIQQPAQQVGVTYTNGTAQRLIDDLRRVLVQHPDGSTEEQLGPYVEPVQLQVVCYRLWGQLPPDASRITDEHLAAVGDVDQSLADYYAEKAAAIALQSKMSERTIRQWVERKLITEGGFRGQVLMGEGKSEGLDNQVIRLLENAHLVRAEKRRGATWFELAHDRLIIPVRQDNARWFQTHLNLLQRQASLWEQQNRAETLKLRGAELDEAEVWAAEHPDELNDIDAEFLQACLELRARERAAQEAAERERQLKLEAAQQLAEAERRRAEEQAQAAGRLRRRAYILAFVFVLALIMAGLAFLGQNAARANAIRADNERAAAEAASTLAYENALQAEANAATALAASDLALQNEAIAQANAATAVVAREFAVAQQATAEYNMEIAHVQANIARSRELSSLALTFLQQNSVLTLLLGKEALDTANTGQALDALLKGLQRNLSLQVEQYDQFIPRQEIDLYVLAASPDGQRIAWGGTDGLIKVWDLVAQEIAWFRIVTEGVTVSAMAFSPDGSLLAVGDASGSLSFWDAESGQRVRNLPSNLTAINQIAYSPDGSTIAYGGEAIGGEANLYTIHLDTLDIQGFRIRAGEVAAVLAIAWSPDGKLLVSGGADRLVHIWDTASGLETDTIKDTVVDNTLTRIYEGPIRSLAFSPNGKWLATGGEDNEGAKNKTLLVWDTTEWAKKDPLVFLGAEENLTRLAYTPDGQTLVAAYRNGETVVWNFNGQIITDRNADHTREVTGLGFSQFQDNLLLVSASLDRTIVLNTLFAMQSLNVPISKGNGRLPRLGMSGDDELQIATAAADGLTLASIDAQGNATGQTTFGPGGALTNYYLSSDGSRIAITGADSRIDIRDLVNGEEFSIDLPTISVTSTSATGETTSESRPGVVDSLAFSPDGSLLAGGLCSLRRQSVDPETNQASDTCLQNDIYIWDVASGGVQKQIPTGQPSAILSLAFNPQQANFLAAGYRNATIQFWDIADARMIGLPLVGQGGPVTSLAFHQDGDILASGSANNLIALWNLNPAQLIGDPLTGSDGGVTGLAFSQNSNLLYSASDRGSVLRWNLAEWKQTACELAKRNLTRSEWEQFFPDDAYRATCKQYPLATSTPLPTPSPTATPTPSP